MRHIINPHRDQLKSTRERIGAGITDAAMYADADLNNECFCDIDHGGKPRRVNVRTCGEVAAGDVLDSIEGHRQIVTAVESMHPSQGNYYGRPIPNVYTVQIAKE